MPSHSVTVQMIEVYQARKPRETHSALDKLPGGGDFIDMVETVAEACRVDQHLLKRDEQQQYAYVAEHKRFGRSLFLAFEVGYYGEPGSVVDSTSGKRVYRRRAVDANLTRTRSLILVPPAGKVALMFNEMVQMVSGGSRFLAHFHSRWSKERPEHTLQTASVVEGEAWLNDANVTEVEALVYNWSPDSSDQDLPVKAQLRQSLTPPRGVPYLNPALWARLRRDADVRREIFGFRDGIEIDQVRVEVEHEGRRKTFEIDDAKTPAIRHLLSGPGEPAKSDEEFRRVCYELAMLDIYPRVGGEWQTDWESDKKP